MARSPGRVRCLQTLWKRHFRWPQDGTHQKFFDAARCAGSLGVSAGHPSSRKQLRHRRVPPTVPERRDQEERRKAKGSPGGRPRRFDPMIYAQRSAVQRGFVRLKQWRGIATRYDKHALAYLGGITLVATLIHLRTN